MRLKFDFLVLGRWVQNNSEETPGIDSLMQQNLHIMNEIFTGGPIMNCENWTLLVNDAWLLGGIHSCIEFQLASPLTIENIYQYNGEFKNQLTVTGRELVGLTTFGYSKIVLRGGQGFVCTDPIKACNANFDIYLKKIYWFTSDQNWMNSLN